MLRKGGQTSSDLCVKGFPLRHNRNNKLPPRFLSSIQCGRVTVGYSKSFGGQNRVWHFIQSWQREVFGKEDTNNHKTENLAQAIVVYRDRRHKS